MKSLITITFFLAICLFNNTAAAQRSEDSVSIFYNAIKSEGEALVKEQLLIGFEKYLEKGGNNNPNATLLLNVSRLQVVETFAEITNVQKVNQYIATITDAGYKANATLAAARQLIAKNKLVEAEALLRPYLESTVKEETPDRMAVQPPKRAFEAEYAVILYKQGKYKEALSYLSPLMTGTDTRGSRLDPGKQEIYTLALIGMGDQTQATLEIEKLLFQGGQRSEEFMVAAQKFYAKLYGNKDYFRKLADSAATVKYNRAVQKMSKYKIDEPAPHFELKDMSGKIISLAALKGKTVVLDFWATWCQPCVASFPGMQRAIDYYKSDPSVVFLFIHSSEHSATPTDDARRLLKAKKHEFQNLMDLKDSATHKSPVQSAFKVTGLPTKFVIDKEGIIRFRHTGFVSEGDAVDEFRAMIDLANKK